MEFKYSLNFMIKKIYIYETRQLDYLPYLLNKLSAQGFEPIVFGKEVIEEDADFIQFKENYEHLSDNPYEFELNCFARYFGIRNMHKGSLENFVISDSDVYVTKHLFNILNSTIIDNTNTFWGSEGFTESVSENQISPHFSIWSVELLENFITYLLATYSLNKKTGFLAKEFNERKQLLGRTAISDMTMLYAWVLEKQIPFTNTNISSNDLGIDHNISSLISADCSYTSYFNRKRIIIKKENLFLKINQRKGLQSIHLIHFQGRYKKILCRFYQGHYLQFNVFSFIIFIGRAFRALISKIQ